MRKEVGQFPLKRSEKRLVTLLTVATLFLPPFGVHLVEWVGLVALSIIL